MALAQQIQMIEFEEKLVGLIRHYRLYEDRRNREQALKHLDAFSAEPNQDVRLLNLLAWFKESFFTWMDSPKCPTCAKPTQSAGSTAPTLEEISASAGRVEIFSCSTCFPREPTRIVARFPRYNNPVKLLETRTGRCGEWANCFTLLCRALGYEVRHASDWTDHVWVEVFLTSQGRWIHCDPCENSFDNPLLYEAGWGKKLTYVIGVSHGDIQDVTWRYTNRKTQSEVISRRLLVPEPWLVSTIIRLRKQMQQNLIPARRKVLETRLVNELVEFISPNRPTAESELRGRISGALEWRQARHETGKDGRVEGFEWEVGIDSEKRGTQTFTCSYNCVQDLYTTGENGIKLRGWNSGVYRSQDIFRKDERDWNMVYLARNPNNNHGSLSWKFVNNSTKLKFRKLVISMESSVFHDSASVTLELSTSSGASFEVPRSCCNSGNWNWVFTNFDDACSWIVLSCRLEGGDGSLAWQHAQLFRQSTTFKGPSAGKEPLHIEISMRKIEE